MNIHNPERLAGESQADYRRRQRASKRAAQSMTLARDHNQRGLPSQREQLRDQQRKNGKAPRGTFAFGVTNAAAVKRAGKLAKSYPQRDEHGAYTVVGDTRRKWLGGISAQRGY